MSLPPNKLKIAGFSFFLEVCTGAAALEQNMENAHIVRACTIEFQVFA